MITAPVGRAAGRRGAGISAADREIDAAVLQLGEVNGQVRITALVSYRDPALAIRCGMPEAIG